MNVLNELTEVLAKDRIARLVESAAPVEYARVAAREQRLHSMLPDRKKDFEYRVAYQMSHQGRNKLATTFPIHAIALAVRGDTTKPILRRRFLQA